MKTETIEFCECEEREIDEKERNFVFYTCKNCFGAIKRREKMCVEFMTSGYCEVAEFRGTRMKCPLDGDFTQCKSGKGEESNGE